jgi:hypothetical protein
MTADFFGATLALSSNDLQEKSDHGKEEQVEEASSGKGQTSRRQEERREKESPASEGQSEGEGQEDPQGSEGCEEGGQGCAQEGQAQSQSRRPEGRAETQHAASQRDAAGCPADFDTACRVARGAGIGDIGIDDATEHRTIGVLKTRRRRS